MKNLIIIILTVFLVVGVASANVSFLDRVADKAGQVLGQVLAGQVKIDNKMSEESEELGALASPTIPSHYLDVGGVQTYYRSMEPKSGTTTPCAIQSPVGTSTLAYFAFDNETATTSAAIVEIGKSETAYATTTLMSKTFSLSANQKEVMYASTTPTSAEGTTNLTTFHSEDWIVVKMVPTSHGTDKVWRSSDSQQGECTAIFRSTE